MARASPRPCSPAATAVVGLTRDPETAKQEQPGVTWHAWEPALERPPGEAFDGVDGVINLIGEKIDQRWTDDAKERIMESRRTATRNLVAAIAGLERKPQVLVSQSAIGYYGDRGDTIVDESDSGGTGGFAAEVVGEWEAAAREAEGTGVRLAIVRTGLVLDPESGLLKRLLLPFKAASAARSPAGASTCPGSISRTRSASCSGRSTARTSTESSSPPPPTP